MLSVWKSAASVDSVRSDKVVFTEKLDAVIWMQLTHQRCKFHFVVPAKKTDGKKHVLCLWFMPDHASSKETQEDVWTTDRNSLPFYIFPWIVRYSYLVQAVDNRLSVLPVSQVFGNLGINNPGKKQERIKPYLLQWYVQPCILFHCIMNCESEKHF